MTAARERRFVSRARPLPEPDLSWLRDQPGRCPDCLLHVETQGHRAPCPPAGPLHDLLTRRAAG